VKKAMEEVLHRLYGVLQNDIRAIIEKRISGAADDSEKENIRCFLEQLSVP
jgi:hypothetical protein